MGGLGSVAKLMPGMGGIDNSQIRAAEARLKKNEAMINSMTKQERRQPALLITDSTARSRLQRIAKGSGMKIQDAQAFMSEFQRMRTMMSRMSKMAPGMNPNNMDPSLAGADGGDIAMPGNRAARRAGKKKKKAGRGFGSGFG
mmetsp:Transcript_102197/g.295667  ORF Transcript_102197/g.295667 Transcript_102197/m.295667 type:complete len:143 (-) Transcript_102197:118-546(-)